MIATTQDLVSHVAGHAGVPREHAERATRVVLEGFGAYLSRALRELVAEELPPELRAALMTDDGLALPLAERVAGPGAPAGHARELIASVCHVLAEELSTDALDALRWSVPPELSAMLGPTAAELERKPVAPWQQDTLATGRAGSRRPVSEARPPVQRASIASANPHGDSKLSSAPGLTQERRHETLAEGEPGYERPLAGTRRG